MSAIGELEKADDPRSLVPGDPERVWEMARSLGDAGVAFEDIGLGFRGIDDGGWWGAAADAFRAELDRQPTRFLLAADAFGTAATALDRYASALNWAQRQAVEAMALARSDEPATGRTRPAATVLEQVEQTGVLGGVAEQPPRRSRAELRAVAVDMLRRARRQVESIGCDTARTVRQATMLAPRATAERDAPVPLVVGTKPRGTALAVRSVIATGVAVAAHHPDGQAKQCLDHETLRDRPRAWQAGIVALRRRLRLGLDQLSPRLKQHIFDGFVKRERRGGHRDLGYHHREGGVDRGSVRVVEVIAGPNTAGVYRARIVGPMTCGRTEPKMSTFFPDAWTRHEVLRAIRHAFANRSFFDAEQRKWRGGYNGIVIEGYVDGPPTAYHIVTAYPRYGP